MARYVYERPTYEEIDKAVEELHPKVYKEFGDFDVLAPVGSGGYVVFRMFLDRERALGRIMPYVPIAANRYEGTKEIREHPLLIIPEYLEKKFNGKRILVLDDISDRGNTLIDTCYECLKISPHIFAATAYYKPHSKPLPVPHIGIKKTSNWVIFPWENGETPRKILVDAKEENWSLEELIEEFRAASFTQQQLSSFIKANEQNEYGQMARIISNTIYPNPQI